MREKSGSTKEMGRAVQMRLQDFSCAQMRAAVIRADAERRPLSLRVHRPAARDCCGKGRPAWGEGRILASQSLALIPVFQSTAMCKCSSPRCCGGGAGTAEQRGGRGGAG